MLDEFELASNQRWQNRIGTLEEGGVHWEEG